jgi:cardiolipin synthase
MFMDHFWLVVTLTGYLLTLLLVPFVLLQRKPNPVSTLAWIMAIINLPFVGGVMFLLFGINRVNRRAMSKQAAREFLGPKLPPLAQYEMLPTPVEQFGPQVQRLLRLSNRICSTRPCGGNQIELLSDTNRTIGLMEQAILAAKESIHLEYYIWQPDRTGKKLRDLLIQKAKEGVVVRFLYDGFGSLALSRSFLKPMRDAGITAVPFVPGRNLAERWSFNLRNHRKITVVDGRIGFTGGMNIGDEYLGLSPSWGYWRDTHLKLQGPTVLQLQQVFAEDWYFATGEPLTSKEWHPEPGEPGDQMAQVISGGPDRDEDVFQSLFFTAINEAHDRVNLATCYFCPTPPLVTSLETAALRGVKVRLIVAGPKTYPATLLAGRSYYQSLLDAGVEIYEYHGGLFHAKTISIDGLWSLVGSPNFDSRSLFLNFEVGVAMYGPRMAATLDEQFELDLAKAQRVDPRTWASRPLYRRLMEQTVKLFSPVL